MFSPLVFVTVIVRSEVVENFGFGTAYRVRVPTGFTSSSAPLPTVKFFESGLLFYCILCYAFITDFGSELALFLVLQFALTSSDELVRLCSRREGFRVTRPGRMSVL